MSLSLFQAEMLNDPEFAKKVKGLEGMLRVVNVCAKLIVSEFRSETLLAKVEVCRGGQDARADVRDDTVGVRSLFDCR